MRSDNRVQCPGSGGDCQVKRDLTDGKIYQGTMTSTRLSRGAQQSASLRPVLD